MCCEGLPRGLRSGSARSEGRSGLRVADYRRGDERYSSAIGVESVSERANGPISRLQTLPERSRTIRTLQNAPRANALGCADVSGAVLASGEDQYPPSAT